MVRATARKADRGFAAELIEEARERVDRVEALADDARKGLVRRVRPVEKRVDAAADKAMKALAKRVRPYEGRVTSLRRTVASWLHEAARVLTRAEKLVAPPAKAKRASRKRARARPGHAAPMHVAHHHKEVSA